MQVELLRDVLLAWKSEVEKKPPAMSTADALRELGLSETDHAEESAIRKAYFANAQRFHPDKNPAGRVSFLKLYLTRVLILTDSGKIRSSEQSL